MSIERSEFRIPRSEAPIAASVIAAMHCHQPIPHPERDGLWFVLAVSEDGDSWKVEVSSMPSARPGDERAALVAAAESAEKAWREAQAAEDAVTDEERVRPSPEVHGPWHKAVDRTRSLRPEMHRTREALQAWDREHPRAEPAPPWNWCPKCKQTVDDDMRTGEFRDGSEGTCSGCRTVYVATAYENGSWTLDEYDTEDEPARATITVERTGESRCFKGPISCEFRVTYPNGHQELIWSPPWNGYGADTETAGALKAAGERWFALCDAWQREVDEWEEARWYEANASK